MARPSKKKETTTGSKKDSAENVILEYLEQQYRPYSVNDIIQNLHGSINKAATVKAIENLTNDGKIITKVLGKMSVSVANKVEASEEDSNVDYDTKLKDTNEIVSTLEKEISLLQQELSQLTQFPDDETLNQEIKSLQVENLKLQERINASGSQKQISYELVQEIQALSYEIGAELLKRRRYYHNVMKYISEYVDTKKLVSDLDLQEPQSVSN